MNGGGCTEAGGCTEEAARRQEGQAAVGPAPTPPSGPAETTGVMVSEPGVK